MSDPDDPSQWQADDVISRGYKHDAQFMELVANTGRVDDIDTERFDALVVAGGQGPMFTFEPLVRGKTAVQAGVWKGFAIRDSNLITGQQNFSGADTAELVVAAVGL
jgi:putative intracellular protease/amidase